MLVNLEDIRPFYFFLICMSLWTCSQQTIASVFLEYTPDYTCDYGNSSRIVPESYDSRCNVTEIDKCHEYNEEGEIMNCENFIWDDKFLHSSVVTEFGLVCDNSYQSTIITTMVFVGTQRFKMMLFLILIFFI